jgi:hypothetical protein
LPRRSRCRIIVIVGIERDAHGREPGDPVGVTRKLP